MFHFIMKSTINRKLFHKYENKQLSMIKEIPLRILEIMLMLFLSFSIVMIGPTFAFLFKKQYHNPTGVFLQIQIH